MRFPFAKGSLLAAIALLWIGCGDTNAGHAEHEAEVEARLSAIEEDLDDLKAEVARVGDGVAGIARERALDREIELLGMPEILEDMRAHYAALELDEALSDRILGALRGASGAFDEEDVDDDAFLDALVAFGDVVSEGADAGALKGRQSKWVKRCRSKLNKCVRNCASDDDQCRAQCRKAYNTCIKRCPRT